MLLGMYSKKIPFGIFLKIENFFMLLWNDEKVHFSACTDSLYQNGGRRLNFDPEVLLNRILKSLT